MLNFGRVFVGSLGRLPFMQFRADSRSFRYFFLSHATVVQKSSIRNRGCEEIFSNRTVDGRNPANQLIGKYIVYPVVYRGFASQVIVWDFFHQQ